MNTDLKFNNADELYNKVLPALKSKTEEFKRDRINYVSEKDIWNYLIKTNWKNNKDIEFYEIVDSILNVTIQDMDNYLVNKLKPINKLEDNDNNGEDEYL